MDRTSNSSLPIAFLIVAAAAAPLVLTACRTTIPETDSEPPEVRLTITGPGIGRQEMSNPPRESWTGPGGVQLFNLLENAEYNFTLSVSDEGGVQRAHLRMSENVVVSDVAPAEVSEGTSGVTRSLTLLGDRGDPRTGLVISGTLEPTWLNESFEFHVEGDDFGGRTGPPNQRFMSVSVFVDDE